MVHCEVLIGYDSVIAMLAGALPVTRYPLATGRFVVTDERTHGTVHDFLADTRMTDAMAIVERDGEIVTRGEYGSIPLQSGDHLEVVHAVGSG